MPRADTRSCEEQTSDRQLENPNNLAVGVSEALLSTTKKTASMGTSGKKALQRLLQPSTELLSKVMLVGRPNVGKSALFNKSGFRNATQRRSFWVASIFVALHDAAVKKWSRLWTHDRHLKSCCDHYSNPTEVQKNGPQDAVVESAWKTFSFFQHDGSALFSSPKWSRLLCSFHKMAVFVRTNPERLCGSPLILFRCKQT